MVLSNLALLFFVSLIIQALIIRFSNRKFFCIDCAESDKPQRFHVTSTPRAGGLGIFMAFAVGYLIVSFNPSIRTYYSALIFLSVPAFCWGRLVVCGLMAN